MFYNMVNFGGFWRLLGFLFGVRNTCLRVKIIKKVHLVVVKLVVYKFKGVCKIL